MGFLVFSFVKRASWSGSKPVVMEAITADPNLTGV